MLKHNDIFIGNSVDVSRAPSHNDLSRLKLQFSAITYKNVKNNCYVADALNL